MWGSLTSFFFSTRMMERRVSSPAHFSTACRPMPSGSSNNTIAKCSGVTCSRTAICQCHIIYMLASIHF